MVIYVLSIPMFVKTVASCEDGENILPYYNCPCTSVCTNFHPSRKPKIIFQGSEMLAAYQTAASNSACDHQEVRVIIGGKGVWMSDHHSRSPTEEWQPLSLPAGDSLD